MTSVLSGEQLVNARIKSERELPVIGLKEFQPSNSWLQNRQIESALCERKALLEEERVEKWGSLSTAVWRTSLGKAEVVRKTGKHWDVFGHHKDNADWLYPEEALFLLEMNCLELLFEDVPMSIQRAYTVLIASDNGCSLIQYRVFLHLSRQGYRVFRHDSELTVTAYEKQIRLDQYVLDQKKHNVNKESCSVVQVQTDKDNEQSVTGSVEVLGESDDTDADSECDIIIEVVKPEKVQSVIQLDESDDDVIEIVYEKTVKEESEQESDEEEERNSESMSDSDSSGGNWKRRSTPRKSDTVPSASSSANSPSRFTRPSVRVNYVTVNEFLYDVDLVRKNCSKPFRSGTKVDDELKKFYNEIEVINLDSEPEEDNRLVITKARNEILDTMRLIRDADGNVVIGRPDERLLPLGVRPKFPLYRINLEAIKSETQKRMPIINPRPYRGRYNPNYHRNRNFNNQWAGNFAPTGGNPINQIAQLQTMARSMMQMASAVLLNSMTSQYQPNWQQRFSNNQIRPVQPQQSNYTNTTPPLVYEYRQNSLSQQNSANFNLPSINSPARNEGSVYRQPFEGLGTNTMPNYRFDYSTRNFNLGNRNSNEDSNDSERNYSPRPYRRPYYRGFRGRRNSNFQNSPRITEFCEHSNSGRAVEDKRSEPDISINPSNVKQERNSEVDPAYTRQDIPASNDFIPIDRPFIRTSENGVHIVDINDKNNDDDVVLIEEEVAHNGVRASGKKRGNPGGRYFCLPKKRRKKQRNKRISKMAKPTNDVQVIDLDNDLDLKQLQERILIMNREGVKNENTDGSSIKIEPLIDLIPVKTEKTDVSQGLGRIKVESVDKIKLENIKDEVLVHVLIKSEKTDSIEKQSVAVQQGGSESVQISNTLEKLISSIVENEEIDVSKVKTEKCECRELVNKVTLSDGELGVVIKEEPNLIKKEKITDLYGGGDGLFNVVKTEKPTEERSEIVGEKQSENVPEVGISQMERNESNNDDCRSVDIDVEVTRSNGESNNDDCRSVDIDVEVTRSNGESKLHDKDEEMEVDEINKNDSEVSVKVVNELLDDVEMRVSETDKLSIGESSEHVACGNEQIGSWAELKKTVSTFVRLEREEENDVEEECDDVRPLLKPQHCQTIGSVLSALQIFKPASFDSMEEEKLKIMFDMYLPSVTFRKASRGLPAYRIIVIGNSSPVPTPGQIMELKKRFQDDVTVLLAVVMADSIAYYILAPVTLPTQQNNV